MLYYIISYHIILYYFILYYIILYIYPYIYVYTHIYIIYIYPYIYPYIYLIYIYIPISHIYIYSVVLYHGYRKSPFSIDHVSIVRHITEGQFFFFVASSRYMQVLLDYAIRDIKVSACLGF